MDDHSAAEKRENTNGRTRIQDALANRTLFLQEFLKNPRQVASIIPSSRFLERRIVRLADIRSARTVVELGAGVGGTTMAILAAMRADARLLTIEINPQFCDRLKQIPDQRLTVHCGSAHEIREALAQYGLPAPDAVVSGIPFSTLPHETGRQILEEISATLLPGGRFLAYQVRSQVDELSRPLLGPAKVEVEYLNIPPLRLFLWNKRNGHGPAAPGSL